MWNLSLFILYIASLLALVSADLKTLSLYSPLNTCILTVQSTIGNVTDPRNLVTYGILNRFAISDPPINPLTITGGGTSGVFEELGNGLYSVGFSVRSDTYDMWRLKNIVTQQWINTNLFERDVGSAGNWKVLSADC